MEKKSCILDRVTLGFVFLSPAPLGLVLLSEICMHVTQAPAMLVCIYPFFTAGIVCGFLSLAGLVLLPICIIQRGPVLRAVIGLLLAGSALPVWYLLQNFRR